MVVKGIVWILIRNAVAWLRTAVGGLFKKDILPSKKQRKIESRYMSEKKEIGLLLEKAFQANKPVPLFWQDSIILRRIRVVRGFYVAVLDYKNRKIIGYDNALNAFIVGDVVNKNELSTKRNVPKRAYNKETLSGEKRVNLTVRIDPAIKSAIKKLTSQSLSSKMEDFFMQELDMKPDEILNIYHESRKTNKKTDTT
ncbi:MAG: hypothetical protein RBR08_16500 [Desulforegulaceae bacterium]|nr:hypothetical protein [Desulforegulaceae bacterium]